MDNLILFIFYGGICMIMANNKIGKSLDIKIDECKDCTKISVYNEVEKSKLTGIIDKNIFDSLDLSLEPGQYFYYKQGVSSALHVILSNRTRMYLSEDGDLSYLMINSRCAYFVFSCKGNKVDSYSLEDDKKANYSNILEFISKYGTIVGDIFLNELPYFSISSRIYIHDAFVKIIERDDIALVRIKNAYCSEESFGYYIVDQNKNAIGGDISMDLSNTGKDNFSYCGNVSYEIYLGCRHKGYASKALVLLKECAKNLDDSYNKELYISTVVDNVYSQHAALKGGAVLYLDTDVPKSDALRFLEKVNHVLIYKL